MALLIERAPKHGNWLAGVALTSWLAAIIVLAFGEAPAGFPPTLMLLPTFVLVAHSLAGGGAGSAAFLAAIGVLAAFKLTHTALGAREFALFVNVGIALTLTQVFGFTFWLTFRRLQRSLEWRTTLISERIEQRSKLSLSFVADFDAALASMARHLAKAEPGSLQALRAGHERMKELLAAARDSLHPGDEAQGDGAWEQALPHFREQTVRLLLWGNIFNLLSILVRIRLTGFGAMTQVLAMIGWSVFLLVLFERKHASCSAVALALAIVAQIVNASAMHHWAFTPPIPNAPFVMTVALAIVCIGNKRTESIVVVGSFAVLALPFFYGGVRSSYAQLFLVDAALGTGLMIFAWYHMESLTKAVVGVLRQRAEELAGLERFRSRICGMLFHDVANPLHTLGMILGLGDELDESDRELIGRMLERLEGLVRVIGGVLEHDDPLEQAKLARVPLQVLCRDMQEVFAYRLRDKGMSLVCKVPNELEVLASPELLRDSVLANLLSNAIKFAPPESPIELHARRTGDSVEIVVRDRGPGWPQEVIERLGRGEKIASTPGTKGEKGLGLGLTLVREHVTRMAGNLSLQPAPGGGSDAVIRLPLPS